MDTLSPVQNRRSRKIAPVGQDDEEICAKDLLNVEDERERLRHQQQAIEEIENISRSQARLSVSEKTVSDHFQSCIQLAAENKINTKNAFNFKLIDLLHSMFNKKKPIKDFTEVSSSLDAGVKIYSCRVDSVHSDTLKMATTVCSSNKAKYQEDEEQTTDAGDVKKKKTVRKTKKTTIASPKEIDRPTVNDKEISPYSVLNNQTLITSSAIFDVNKVCWHLNTSLNFWENEKPIPYDRQKISIDYFPDVPEDMHICTTFRNFRFGEDANSVKSLAEERMSAALKIDYEPPNNEGVFDDDIFQDDQDMIDDIEAPNHESMESQNHVACLSKMMSSTDFIVEISNLISSEKSDYRYFNFQQLQKKMNPRNTQHWAPLRNKSTVHQKRPREEKKEPIDFLNIEEDEFKVFQSKNDPSNVLNTVAPRERFLLKQITDFSVNKFFRLNVWRDMFVLPNAKDAEENPSELEEMIEDYNYDNPNDTLNTLPDHYDDDYCEDRENVILDDAHGAPEKNAFLMDNLVEVPNKVAKIQLPFMAKDKSVNMKELKSKIWKEIETSEPQHERESSCEPITFMDICKKIMIEENGTAKKELSIPIMFNAILQLANDRTLALSHSRCDQSDFIVRVDTVNKLSS